MAVLDTVDCLPTMLAIGAPNGAKYAPRSRTTERRRTGLTIRDLDPEYEHHLPKLYLSFSARTVGKDLKLRELAEPESLQPKPDQPRTLQASNLNDRRETVLPPALQEAL